MINDQTKYIMMPDIVKRSLHIYKLQWSVIHQAWLAGIASNDHKKQIRINRSTFYLVGSFGLHDENKEKMLFFHYV